MKNLGEHKVVVCPYFLHLFPGHNFAVCDWIKIIFGTNESKQDDVSQAKFRQGQRSILKQIRFRAITLLFMVGFKYEEHPLVQSISLFILINSEPSSFKKCKSQSNLFLEITSTKQRG